MGQSRMRIANWWYARKEYPIGKKAAFNLFMFLIYIHILKGFKKQVSDRDQKNQRAAPIKQFQSRAVGKYGANTFPHLLHAATNLKLFEWAPTANFDYYQELFWDTL